MYNENKYFILLDTLKTSSYLCIRKNKLVKTAQDRSVYPFYAKSQRDGSWLSSSIILTGEQPYQPLNGCSCFIIYLSSYKRQCCKPINSFRLKWSKSTISPLRRALIIRNMFCIMNTLLIAATTIIILSMPMLRV